MSSFSSKDLKDFSIHLNSLIDANVKSLDSQICHSKGIVEQSYRVD